MATQDTPKRKTRATQPEERTKVETEVDLPRTKDEEQARQQTEAALTEARDALATAQAELKQEGQAWAKTEQVLAETQESLAVAQAEVKRERQARVKAERALEEAKGVAKTEAVNTEQSPVAPREDNGEQQVSFIVRVTVDERGEPRRTKIERAQSGEKKSFSTLDTKGLSDFIRAHLSPPIIPETAIPTAPPPATGEAPPPKPSRPAVRLTITNLELRRVGFPTGMALTLNLNEPFVVQAGFKLEGSEVLTLTGQESGYEVQIQAYEVTSGTTTVVTTHRGNLVKDMLDYQAFVQAPGLSPGLYRLKTLITLQEPTKLAGRYEGPVFQVGEIKPADSPAVLQEAVQPQ